MAPTQITCAFCGVLNNPADTNCMACGAPLEVSRPIPVTVTVVPDSLDNYAAETNSAAVQGEPLKQQFKEGLAAVGASLGFAGIGGLLLRTFAEAMAIAIAAMIVGFSSGSSMTGGGLFLLLGLGGGALIGIAVGLVVKRSLFVLFSAPFGALAGALAAILLRLNQAGSPWVAVCATASACLLAVLGGRLNSSVVRFKAYNRIRPLLGALGGILFALIGYLIGLLF